MRALRFIVAVSTFYLFVAGVASASCGPAKGVELLSPTSGFLPSDFPLSELSPTIDPLAHERYQVWASRQANEIAEEFSNRDSEELLETVGAGRRAIAKHTHDRSPFGIRRDATDPLWMSKIGSNMSEKPMDKKLLELTNKRVAELERHDGSSVGTKYVWSPNAYTSMNGVLIEGTRIMYSEMEVLMIETGKTEVIGTYALLHSSFKNGQNILHDVFARLNHLKNKSLTKEEKIEEFSRALFGYYNAYPYRRGTSSIGRVYFPGVFKDVFGVKSNVFEDGIDVIAMISGEQTFLKEFGQKIRMQLP